MRATTDETPGGRAAGYILNEEYFDPFRISHIKPLTKKNDL